MIKDIILLIVVIAGVVSFFYNPINTDMKYLQLLMSGIVGYYVGGKQIPVLTPLKGALKNVKRK